MHVGLAKVSRYREVAGWRLVQARAGNGQRISSSGQSGDKAQHLDAKMRELISLAVAVATRCDGCVASHVEAAMKHGVSKAEIAEALGVAIAMNAGAALVYTARTLDCFDQMSGTNAAA